MKPRPSGRFGTVRLGVMLRDLTVTRDFPHSPFKPLECTRPCCFVLLALPVRLPVRLTTQ